MVGKTLTNGFSKNRSANWAPVALELDLHYQDGLIEGVLERKHVTVKADSTVIGSLVSETVEFVFEFEQELPTQMLIRPSSLGDKITAFLGAQDVQIGLANLDSALTIKAENEDVFQKWVGNQAILDALQNLSHLHTGTRHSFDINQNRLKFEHFGPLDDAGELGVFIGELAGIAEAISSPAK